MNEYRLGAHTITNHSLTVPFINAATDGEGLLGLDPSDQQTLRPSKDWAFIVLFAYFCLMYSLKGCATVLYRRLTYVYPVKRMLPKINFYNDRLGLWQRKIIFWNGILCIVLWAVSCMTYIFPCVPFSVRFKVIPEPQCEWILKYK